MLEKEAAYFAWVLAKGFPQCLQKETDLLSLAPHSII